MVEASTASLSLSGSDSGSDASPSTQTSGGGSDSTDSSVTSINAKEKFKDNIMKKSIDDLLHDQNSVDSLIGGAVKESANEFVEVDQQAMQN